MGGGVCRVCEATARAARGWMGAAARSGAERPPLPVAMPVRGLLRSARARLRSAREVRARRRTAAVFTNCSIERKERCECGSLAPPGDHVSIVRATDADGNEVRKSTNAAQRRAPLARALRALLRAATLGLLGRDEPASDDIVDLWGPHLYGSRKFLGGAVDISERYLYGVPAHARFIIKVDTRTGECTRLHDGALPRGDFKWLRGVRAANGCIYCIPACASQVLKIDPSDDSYTLFGGDVIPKGTWKWHGGSLAKSDGNIYCIPANARRVLRIEPATDTVSLHGPDLTDYPGAKNKWYGGIKGKDGSIWGIPYNATRALKIVPQSAPGADDVQVTTVGPEFPRGGWKWHGGTADRATGAIWGVSSHYNGVMKITPETETIEVLGTDVVGDGKYKFGGAVADSEGHVWCLPSDCTYALKISPARAEGEKDKFERVGNLSDWGNKWQGGVLVPGAGDEGGDAVYAIPCDATQVLKIHCATNRLELMGKLPSAHKKFQGAYGANDGTIWGLPESARHVLRIRPAAMSAAPHVPAGHTDDKGLNVSEDGKLLSGK